jgi:hypothetical protein
MNKILLAFVALAACAVSTATLAQPMHRDGAQRAYAAPHHRKHKVWVPAHREHGRRVAGHYVWR